MSVENVHSEKKYLCPITSGKIFNSCVTSLSSGIPDLISCRSLPFIKIHEKSDKK